MGNTVCITLKGEHKNGKKSERISDRRRSLLPSISSMDVRRTLGTGPIKTLQRLFRNHQEKSDAPLVLTRPMRFSDKVNPVRVGDVDLGEVILCGDSHPGHAHMADRQTMPKKM